MSTTKTIIFLSLACVLWLPACGNPVQASNPITVSLPSSETIWKEGSEFLVQWTGGNTDSVFIQLLKSGACIDSLAITTANSGEFSLSNGLQWTYGEDYQIRVTDFSTESGTSDEFSIWNIVITEPSSVTTWIWNQTNTEVEWMPGSGSIVRMEIWKAGSKVDDYCDWTDDDGSYIRLLAIPAAWGEGDDYQIKMIDDLNNVGWSYEFYVENPFPSGMEFVFISQGSFEMGAPVIEQGSYSRERPVHTVTFNYDFQIMTTEVTHGMWLKVMGSNPSHFTGIDHPVEKVSWYDCQDFVDAMNYLDPSFTYRLPSESEWEYCCRAGSTERYYWGEDLGETVINGYAWWSGNSGSTTHSVAEKLPNAWGLYDMSGNVWEWCEDWYHSNYNGAPADGTAWVVPQGSGRVSRGGSRSCCAMFCRSAFRDSDNPGGRYSDLGLRLVRTVR